MKTDISRSTFRTSKYYSAVRMQQGRVVLDTDWNEQVDIENHRSRILTVDSLGPVGAPAGDAGFQISPSGDTLDLLVSPGRFYIDGILVRNEAEFNVSTQTDLPGVALPAVDGNYLAYLKVHERAVTALEDPEIRETALGGPDTTTRSRVIRQILLTSVTGTEFDSRTIPAEWNTIISRNPGRMSARTEADGGSDPCAVGTRGGYTGLDNLLYRVEIHDGGQAGTATYKWSRDNGALVTEWLEQEGDTLTVRSTGNDNVLNFQPGQWIEISDDGLELEGLPGTLAQILRVEGRRITINPDNIQHFPGSAGTLDINEFSRGVRKIRRWDFVELSGVPTVPDGAGGEVWITLENGIEIKFDDLASAREFRTGDYWLIPARADNNNIQWACDNNGNIEHDPDGIYFSYARLAFVNVTGGVWSVIADAREIFPGLTDEELAYVGGDGQLSVPGQILDRPLEVRVTRGATPVADAKVRFTVTSGTGTIEDTPGGTSGTTLDIKADSDGIARVHWTLADAAAGQSVTAVLLDETDQTTALYVTFGAGSGVASGIQYTPISTDSSVTGTTNVQEALDALADNKVNRSGDTMTGNLTVNADLEVTGNMTIRGDVIARDAQQQAGDVLLGDDDIDRVIIHGTLESNHTSGSLEVEAPVHINVTDPTKAPLRVDGPSTGGSPRLFRLPLDLDNTAGGAVTLTDYQLPITVDTATPIAAGRMESDGADILFEDQDGTNLPYWVESGINTATTSIWVRIPSLPAATNRTIYMLYGNDSAVSQSSSSATFVREVPNVQAAFELNEGSGTTVVDLSGNGLDGTITGSANWTPGQFGPALDFDGTSTVVTLPAGNLVGTGATPFTAGLWLRPESVNDTIPVRLTQDTQFVISLSSFGIDGGFRTAQNHPIPVNISSLQNQWNHLVVAYNGGDKNLAASFEIYLNGTLLDSSTANLTLGPIGGAFNDNALGSDVNGSGVDFNFFDGQMSDVRIYTRVLAQSEVQDIYNNKGYLTPANPGVELVRRFAAIEPVVTAQAEEANPLSDAPIIFAQETSGNVGIGTDAPGEKLTVDGIIETKVGGIKFPDGTIQTTAGGGGPGGGGDSLPLGTIMAWHRDFQGTPAVPDGWVECNGQSLNDPDSPYDGLVIPNLNGAPSGANSPGTSGKYEMFLRGGTTSGEGQLDQFQGHRHLREPSGLLELYSTPGGISNLGGAGGFSFGGVGNGTVTGDPVDGVQGPIRQGDETRPVNMSVIWIMKIKLVDGQSGLWVPGTEGIRYTAGNVSVGTDVSDEQLTVSGAISIEEKVLEPDTTDDFGKVYVRENDLSYLTLDGAGQYATLPSLDNAAVADFTIAVWARIDETPRGFDRQSWIFDTRQLNVEGSSIECAFHKKAGSEYEFFFSFGWDGSNFSQGNIPIGATQNQWRHFVMSRAGSGLRVFIDGRLITTEPDNATPAQATPLPWNVPWSIGRRSNPGPLWETLPGGLDDLAVWDRALSEDEIATLHNAGRGSDVPTAFASSLLAFYPMSSSLTPGQLDDTSGNNRHGTIQSGGSITPERVGTLYFKDGFGNVTALAGGGDSYRTGGSGNQVPLGTIMAWHKSFVNTPAIPDGWVECNGQVLDDPASPYNGQVIPDLNNPKESWNSKGMFLRGDTSSGIFDDDRFQGHRHGSNATTDFYGNEPGGGAAQLPAGSGGGSNPTTGDPTTDGPNGTPRFGSETKPVNFSVVWIMKIRETDRDRGLWRENGEDIYFDDGKVGVGAKTANAKVHISAEDHFEAPLRVDAQVTIQGVQGRLYRQPIALANLKATAFADFQTSITVDTLALVQAGKMRADGGDILFTDADGKTILPHFIESGMNTAETLIWVRVSVIGESANRTIFMQYGKPDATQGGSAEITFDTIIDDVAAAYDMDEGGGSSMVDKAGFGTVLNHNASFTGGIRGTALQLNGSNQNAASNPRNWGFGSTGSVSVWIKTTSSGSTRTIMSLQHGSIQDEFLLDLISGGTVSVYNHKSASNFVNRQSISPVNTGEWVHIVGVLDGGIAASQLRIYINGVREDGPFGSNGSPSPINDSTPRTLTIGSRPGASQFFNGAIDRFRLYSRALTDAEVTALYEGESSLPPSDPGREYLRRSLATDLNAQATREITDLAGAWNMDEGSGTSITDYSGNGNTGSLSAGATWTADRNGNANRALLFDGVDDFVNLSDQPTLNLAGDITLSAWIRNTGPGTGTQSGDQGMIISRHWTGGSRSYDLHFDHTTQSVRLQLFDTSDVIHALNSGTLNYNEWYHVAGTYEATSGIGRIYVNGVESTSQNLGTFALQQNAVRVAIGCLQDSPDLSSQRGFFKGTIDDARIYNRALTAEEIADLHQFGGILTINTGTEYVLVDPNAVIASNIAAEEPNPVSGSPILFAQNLTGNIGIGTDDPLAKLHIAGTAGVDGIMFPDGTVQTTAGGGAGGGDSTPLGTIIAWHKSLTGTPAIPDGWVECNGQTLDDIDSPYDGEIIPNLNGDPTGANSPDLTETRSMFLRGGLTSGDGQDDAFEAHTHAIAPMFDEAGAAGPSGAIARGDGANSAPSGATTSTGDSETRPVNMTVVWIMKVKQSAAANIWQINANDTFYNEGNVAIGTNTANAKLTVDGDLSIKEGGTVPDADLGFAKIYAQEATLRHIQFDGANDYVSMPALGQTGIDTFTFACWFKMDAHNPHAPNPISYLLDTRGDGVQVNQGVALHFLDLDQAGGEFRPSLDQPTDGRVALHYQVGDITGQWHHAAFVREGTVLRSYIDGRLVSDNPTSGTSTGESFEITSGWRLGTQSFGTTPGQDFWLNGSLSQIAFWRRPLAAYELQAIFAQGREVDLMQNHSRFLIGYWPVDSNDTGTTLNDHSGNNFHGTLQANASFANEIAGSLYYKDGRGTTTTLAGANSFPWSAGSTGRDVPIGTIMAWHKDLSGTPAIPDGWVECNGQVLSDPDSPYNTQTIPNLNGDPAGADSPDLTDKKSMFLRGSLTSGTGQDDAFQGHWHEPPFDQGLSIDNSGGVPFSPSGGTHPNNNSAHGAENPISDGVNGTPRTADETRPVNMSVVWIMKIKHTGNGVWINVPQGVSFDNGDVGIGTTAPVSKLTVDGALSLREDIPTPGATLGFGKLYTRSTDLSYLDLDGVGGHVSMPALGNASVGDFTASLWFRMRTIASNIDNRGYLLDLRGDVTEDEDGPILTIDSDTDGRSFLRHFVEMPSGPGSVLLENIGNITGEWHHTVMVREGSALRIYMDGRFLNDRPDIAATTEAINWNTLWRLGGRSGGTTNWFYGAIDDVALWNRTLSDDDIAAIYNSGRGTDLTERYSVNLVGFWPMDDGAASATIRDASGNGFDGTLQSGATIVEEQAGSLLFQDGFGNTTTLAGSGGSFGSSGGGREVPLGTIMAWHKDLTGTPSMPPGWVECNGQVLSDVESPYDGQTIPNLNGDPAGADSPDVADKKSMFLRGGLTSGTGQDDAMQGHIHGAVSFVGNLGGGGGGNQVYSFGSQPGEFFTSPPLTDSTNGTPRTADETRPVNMSVVWIMKIKHVGDAAWEPATNGLAYMGGRVGIGTTTPAYELDVNGTIRGANVSPSDLRWKTNVAELDGALGLLRKLRGVRFDWNTKTTGGMALSGGSQLGLIAQEVEDVLPEVVSTAPDGYKSIEYGKLVAVLIEAIKELTDKE